MISQVMKQMADTCLQIHILSSIDCILEFVNLHHTLLCQVSQMET
jgi:hypothetical protein